MKKIAVRACVGVLVFFMASIFLRFFTLNIFIEKFNMTNPFVRTVFFDWPEDAFTDIKINWVALYPSENTGTRSVNPDRRNTLERTKEKILEIEKKIEKYTSDNLVFQSYFAKTAIKYEKTIGWNIYETIYDLGGGFFTETTKANRDIDVPARAISDLYDFIAGLGIDFLYAQAPHKISGEDPLSGTVDFSNQNADRFLQTLASKNIPFLDLREIIKRENLDHHGLFYKTDHHWKAETGLWAAGIIAGHLNAQYGFEIDLGLFKPEQYRVDLYERWFLGSVGKKLTLERADPEDFTLLYPRFATDYSLQIPSKGINREGSFDILYDLRQVAGRDYYRLNPYAAHLYGDNPLTVVRNNRAPNNKKILLVKDSFSLCVAPFLSAGIENLDLLDLRHFDGSIKSYVRENKPDIVIVIYYPRDLQEDGADMFSFR